MKNKFIGFYDYTVILTFVSLLSTILGMTQAIDGHFRIALMCLAISGLCDTFDGKIARTKKDRDNDHKLYGIQLDSLCDVVCFGAFPVMICYLMGVHGLLGGLVCVYYCICGVIRLGWFNVLETDKLSSDAPGEKVYHGLPITTIVVILPLTFLLSFVVRDAVFPHILTAMLFVTGTLFIVDFQIRKPKNWVIFLLIGIVGVAVLTVLLFSRLQIGRRSTDNVPLIDVISNYEDE